MDMVFSDIVHIQYFKAYKFWVAKMYGNNGIFYLVMCDTAGTLYLYLNAV